MENKIQELYERILDKKKEYTRLYNLFGEIRPWMKPMLWEISGMEKAFEVMAGHSFTQHQIMLCNAALERWNNK